MEKVNILQIAVRKIMSLPNSLSQSTTVRMCQMLLSESAALGGPGIGSDIHHKNPKKAALI